MHLRFCSEKIIFRIVIFSSEVQVIKKCGFFVIFLQYRLTWSRLSNNVRRGGRAAEGNGLLNRRMGKHPYRGFESRPLRYFVDGENQGKPESVKSINRFYWWFSTIDDTNYRGSSISGYLGSHICSVIFSDWTQSEPPSMNATLQPSL